jgi:hypothetical protein
MVMGGNDEICGGNGNEVINSGDGDERINSGGGNDQLYGLEADDVINCGPGDDLIDGRVDSDIGNAGPGQDICFNVEIASNREAWDAGGGDTNLPSISIMQNNVSLSLCYSKREACLTAVIIHFRWWFYLRNNFDKTMGPEGFKRKTFGKLTRSTNFQQNRTAIKWRIIFIFSNNEVRVVMTMRTAFSIKTLLALVSTIPS